jgi:hypothetical protein
MSYLGQADFYMPPEGCVESRALFPWHRSPSRTSHQFAVRCDSKFVYATDLTFFHRNDQQAISLLSCTFLYERQLCGSLEVSTHTNAAPRNDNESGARMLAFHGL